MRGKREEGQWILLMLFSTYILLGWHFPALGHCFSWAFSLSLPALIFSHASSYHLDNGNSQISISSPELKLLYHGHLNLNMWIFPTYG